MHKHLDNLLKYLKRRKIITSVVLFAAVLLCYGFGLFLPPRPINGPPIVIERGSSANKIADLLKDNNVIRSKTFFVWATYVTGIHDELRAGSFHFSEPVSVFGAIAFLEKPRSETTVLIHEGSTIYDIAELLAEKEIIDPQDFIEAASDPSRYDFPFLAEIPEGQTLEGYLFPDTYRFFEDTTADEIIRTMLDNFSKKINKFSSDIAAGEYNTYEIVTLASIIEKEVHSDDDRAFVASVLLNRLGIGMALQADATLYYVTGRASLDLTMDDLKINSPYNTYRYPGLPAGPISNPGEGSIQAALHPADTPYVYYLSDSDGITYFAETFEEHKQNKFKYLK